MIKNIVIFVFGAVLCFFVQDYIVVKGIAERANVTANDNYKAIHGDIESADVHDWPLWKQIYRIEDRIEKIEAEIIDEETE